VLRDDERRLIEQAQGGDRAALGELYRRHADVIYRYICMHVGDPVVAEDLTAEVFLNMLQGLRGYRYTGAPFMAWLYRIAHARTVDHWRRVGRRQETTLPEGLAATGDDPEATVSAHNEQKISTILEICLNEVAAGRATIQDCLERYPDRAAELAPLLRAAERVRTSDRPSLSPQTRARIEAQLLAAAENMPSPQPAPALRLAIAWTLWWAALGLILLCALVNLSGAGLVVLAGGAQPDSPLYPVKLATEKVWLWVTPTQGEPALHLRFARRRLDEVRTLAEREQFDARALSALTAETDAALSGAETLPPQAARALLRDCLQVVVEQGETLAALVEVASPAERDPLTRALQASGAHRSRAFQMMWALPPQDEPGEADQATPTPSARITVLPSQTPRPPHTPTLTGEAQTPTRPAQPTVAAGFTPPPRPAVTTTRAPEATAPTSTHTPQAASGTPGPRNTTVPPTQTPTLTQTVEHPGTRLPSSATPTPDALTATPASQGCVYGHGYWKNHPDLWPVSALSLGDETCAATELLGLLDEPIHTDASLILARQLIAARLNLADGADDSTIAPTIAAADAWLDDYAAQLPYDVAPDSPQGQEAVSLADTLEQYNEGTLPGGPLYCP
jgi:RNA polymerase sigma factor (sigma-70 family)